MRIALRAWVVLVMTLVLLAAEEEAAGPKRDPLVIGATLVMRKAGCKIRALVKDGPAMNAGMAIDDIILKVNNQAVEKCDATEIGRLISLKNPALIELRDAGGKIKMLTVFKVPQSRLMKDGSLPIDAPVDPLDELKPGDSAPNITAQYSDGRQITLADWHDVPRLVIFWASWNRASVSELPKLKDLYLRYHGLGLEFLGVSLDSDKNALDHFCQEQHLSWPQHFDGRSFDGGVVSEWGVTTVPTVTLINRDGKIIAEDLHGDELEKAVITALRLEKKLGWENSDAPRTVRRPRIVAPPAP